MDHEEYRAYGEGWIRFLSPAPPGVSVTGALAEIRRAAQRTQELHDRVGPLSLGPAGTPPERLTAVDGGTGIDLSPQLREFYSFARWWSGNIELGEVPDPGDFLELLTAPGSALSDLIGDEFEFPAVLVDAHGEGLDPARCVLFSVDTLRGAPYNRTYLVFSPDRDEPEVWGFWGDHFHSPDLRTYLAYALPRGAA